MINKFILLILLNTFLFAQTPYYTDKVSQFKMLSNQTKPIMMIGDSITDRGLWNELLKRNDIVNRGISGDTTDGLLNRIAINNKGLKKVFIMIGINDLLREKSVEDVYRNYIKILEYYKSNRVTPIVESTLYVQDESVSQTNQKVKNLNNQLKEYTYKNKIIFIDLNEKLSPNGYLDSQYTNDRVHLNGKGYQLWANTLEKYLD